MNEIDEESVVASHGKCISRLITLSGAAVVMPGAFQP
jgi:hypothetical protein